MWNGRTRRQATGSNVKLEMTPMIDVVFLLLIFFIVTLKTEDIFAQLAVARPRPSETESDPDITLLEVMVYDSAHLGGHGFVLQGRRVSAVTLEARLKHIAGLSRDTAVMIKCTEESAHAKLVDVLNICSKVGLSNLNVFTLGSQQRGK